MTSDKRGEPRYEISSTVSAQWSGSPGAVDCAASDISRHGIFLEMDAPPRVETLIHIGPPGASVAGRVVFTLAPSDAQAMGRRPGVGVQLDAPIDPDTFLLRCSEARARQLAMLDDDIAMAVPAAATIRPASSVLSSASARHVHRGEAPSQPAPRPAPAQQVVSDVVIIEGTPGQAALVQALTADDYAPLIAKHGFEALVLCLRRRPLLCIADVDALGLGGRRLFDEIRRHDDLAEITLVLVDDGARSDPGTARTVRWRNGPGDVDKARRLIDAALGAARPTPRSRGPDDARVVADAVSALARRLDDEGDTAAALGAVRYAAELAPSVAGHTLLLARILVASAEQRERDEAAALIERLVRQDPRSAEAYTLRAAVLDQRGRRDEARTALKRTLMFAPDDVEANAGLKRLDAGEPLIEIRAARAARSGGDTETDAEKPKGGFLGKLFKR